VYKVYAMAFDGGDGSMGVALFDSIEACQYAEEEDPEAYRAEGYYKEVYVTSLEGVHTMNSLIEEYSYDLVVGTFGEIPLGSSGPCTLALP
jgi:hypothetical protein